jgi:transcriptional regulator with XRE-family HTH domain
MNYATQAIAVSLKKARVAKGLSQRDLSLLVGVPQAQISRIEAGTVDPRASSLVALARALDMDLVLIPRKALPAVATLARQSIGEGGVGSGGSRKEISRIAETLRNLQVKLPDLPDIAHLQKSFADLERLQITRLDSSMIKNLRKAVEQIAVPIHQHAALVRSAKEMQRLRNHLAHLHNAPHQDDRPKPAYALDDHDGDDDA